MGEYDGTNISDWTRLGMRKAFGKMMLDIANDNEDIIVLAADIASSAGLVEYAENFPKRFYNIGIAEMNMTGIAAGLAKEGNNVFITSFAPFVSMRAYEAIRTLVGYMHLNVKIVGLGSGLSLGVQGNTHYCMEDMALMRLIPGMTVLSPADCLEEMKCLEYLSVSDGPAYLRLTGIDGSPNVYKKEFDFSVGNPNIIREGEDVVFFATGSIVNECLRASRALKKDGLTCSVVDVHTIKPINGEKILDICKKHKWAVSVEEHFTAGGLGSLISEVLSTDECRTPLLKIGIQDCFLCSGNYSYLLDRYELSAPHIKEQVLKIVNERKE